ncbi:hypothetical protein NDU88_006908 [Pleurodeles waltl]|uniref:Uncharacterized protein n=1 Tax=Pleurodeles waltl TaxID=8319 RepID=A0AAV7TZW3_PLEWA|nr:hypothetical protein NDU88_006908 [Pleurodeles waltl]
MSVALADVDGTLAGLTGTSLELFTDAETTADVDLVAEGLGWVLATLARGEGRGWVGKKSREDEPGDGLVAAVETVDSEEEEAEEEEVDNRSDIIQQHLQ